MTHAWGTSPLEYLPTPPTVNVDTAHSRGAAMLKSMEGKTSDGHPFRRKDQCVTLGPKSYIKIDGEEVQVDPQLLF